MTNFTKLMSLLILMCFTKSPVKGQTLASSRVHKQDIGIKTEDVIIRGKVTSSNGEPLPGATVVVKGTSNGTVTDMEGSYTLRLPEASGALVISFVGFTSKEVSINNQSIINISLSPDIQSLNEVVVVGYGTQKKSDITGAISSISAKEITELPIANAQQALQGRSPGVDVVSTGNRPGSGVNVRIRGRRSFSAGNEPLYVVDGIPLAGGINDINPQDIESMEILKDASATAIYGSRGANGVVIITTKRGKAGETIVSYDTYHGASQAMGTIDMMNGAQFAEYKRESRRAVGQYTTDENLFEPVELESIRLGRSTNYQELLLRTGYQQSHQIGVLGGSSKTKFAISGNYFDETGIISGQDFNRNTIRVNLDHQVNDRLTIGTSTLTSLSFRNGGNFNPYGGALAENPLGVPYDDEGNIIFLPTTDGLRTNPLAEIVPGANVDESRRTRIFSSIYGQYKILDGLSYRLNFGPDMQQRRDGRFIGSQTNSRRGGDPTASIAQWNTFSYTLENVLQYSKTFKEKHSLNLTGLYSIQSEREEWNRTAVRGVPAEPQQFYNIGAAPIIEGYGSNLTEWSIQSYMGRVNYSFNNKYLLTLTGRMDGSSRFAPGKKYGFFPSIAAGWNISEEDFMKRFDFVTNLKLRASYGITGNTGINPYQTQGGLYRTTYAFGNSGAFGYTPGLIPNPDLTWETSASGNFGVDYGFFNGRISGSIEVYRTNTTDLLMERQLPVTGGYDRVLENVGATRNTGVEFSVSTVNLALNNGFRWTTDVNFFSNKEEIVELYGGKEDDIGNNWFIGKPLTVFYDFEKAGIWQSNEEDAAKSFARKPGEIKIKDQNSDGVINSNDRIILGSDIPDWSGGMTNRFEFKGFDLSVFIFTRQGGMIRSLLHDGNNTLFGRYNNLNVDYWTPNNPTNAYPRPNQNQERPVYASSMTYFDGSFLKVRNINFGYNFSSAFSEKLKIKSLRIYASAQNPFIFASYRSKHKGVDPEMSQAPQNNRERTAEIGADTPSSRLILFGINAKF
jgi:TonB-linked SusC/RagA family outer membrane protein